MFAIAAPTVSQARGAERFNRSGPSGPVFTGARVATLLTVRKEKWGEGARLYASVGQAPSGLGTHCRRWHWLGETPVPVTERFGSSRVVPRPGLRAEVENCSVQIAAVVQNHWVATVGGGREWLAVNAGDEHNAAPSDWMARRGCTPSRMRRSSRRNRRPRALRRGRGLSGNAESPPHVVVRRERWVGAADGDRERVHLAVPSRIESPLLRARRDGAAVGGTRRPQHVEQAVSLKPHRRWLAVGCRRHDAAPPERAVRRRCAPPRMRSRSRDGCRQPAVVGVDRSETSMQAI